MLSREQIDKIRDRSDSPIYHRIVFDQAEVSIDLWNALKRISKLHLLTEEDGQTTWRDLARQHIDIANAALKSAAGSS